VANISPIQAARVDARPPRKVSGFRVYCDESNTEGSKRHPVYGAILIAWEDIETVRREIADWRQREQFHGEIKWERMRGGLQLNQYKSLVDLLFSLIKHRKLFFQFKAIILDRHAPEYRVYSKGNAEIGFYKTHYHWLLRYFCKFPLMHRCRLRVIIDERNLPKNVKDPFTQLRCTLNNGIRKELDATADDVVIEVKPLDSKESDLLQVADVLMGAVGYHNQDFHLKPDASRCKVALARYIAQRVGLGTLKEETHFIKEDFKIVRWHWPSHGPKPRHRRRAADKPRPSSRRPSPQR
jgi:hypothetical protein